MMLPAGSNPDHGTLILTLFAFYSVTVSEGFERVGLAAHQNGESPVIQNGESFLNHRGFDGVLTL